ncbi:multiple inositol polyphosphate phosphatase 1-like [Copidosoma floridanum]|uniref:multiple inositol polyphosphate phosphatase 1-like n=1 Tax=Copidosoma floridanum TaxID=29053 RepID=UPI000C6FBE5A|nr:multiple inositol polyphosphate phosphatase 1-like [Copidosoma floridanum]
MHSDLKKKKYIHLFSRFLHRILVLQAWESENNMKTASMILAVLAALVVQGAAREYDYCYAYDNDHYLLMGTKTAYQFVYGRSRIPPVPSCTPIQIWILARHGTRYPGREFIRRLPKLLSLRDQIINDNEPFGRLCGADLEFLRNWRPNPNMNEAMADFLTPQGEQDIRLLAKRLQSEFPELLRPAPQNINQENYKLLQDSIQLMYDMCRYEKALEIDRLSTWCSVFSKDELKTLEYLEDLDYYYYSGPGREINTKLGCPLMKDLFDHFRNLERGNFNNEPKGVFYFSHTVTLQTLLDALGTNKDPTPLRADNYRSMYKRSFRTSTLGSFASNLIAVFYRCSDPRSPNKVMFYQNEAPVPLDGCSVGLCDWEYLKEKFGGAADECSLDFCYNTGSGLTASYVALAGLMLAITRFGL